MQRVLLLISRASLHDLTTYIGLKIICTSLLDRMMSFMNSIGSAASSSASSTASSSASATASSIAPIVSTVVEKVSIKSSWVWEYFSTDAKKTIINFVVNMRWIGEVRVANTRYRYTIQCPCIPRVASALLTESHRYPADAKQRRKFQAYSAGVPSVCHQIVTTAGCRLVS